MVSAKLGARYKFIFEKKLAKSILQKVWFSSVAASRTPLAALKQKIDSGDLLADEHQSKATKALDDLYYKIQNYKPQPINRNGGLFSIFTNSNRNGNTPMGVYLYGSVGGGKTTLMDMFYDCCNNIGRKKRVHFNSFMTNVHSRIHEAKEQRSAEPAFNSDKPSPFDPTRPVADIIAQESWLLCFDEFQVTDIADAMILKRLFTHLFDQGVIVVATSNRHPNDLYKNGLQRSNFVPFIGFLMSKCHVVPLESGVDYRRTLQKGTADGNFFIKSQTDADVQIDRMFKLLCTQENDMIRPRTITHFGRDLTFAKTCGQVLDSTFNELCDRPLAGSDYLQIAQFFHTVLIRDVPQFNSYLKSQARRFIILIDTLYDNRVRVVISSDVSLDNLFSKFLKTSSENLTDEQRILMDDLKIEGDSNASSLSVFSGEEEIFAFDRTISRLFEMQTQEYWQQWQKHR